MGEEDGYEEEWEEHPEGDVSGEGGDGAAVCGPAGSRHLERLVVYDLFETQPSMIRV
jgi:hypothetical protein